MSDFKYLPNYPSVVQVPYTVHQVVGDSPVAAWDIIPLSMKEVAAATKVCKIYGKLFRAVRVGGTRYERQRYF